MELGRYVLVETMISIAFSIVFNVAISWLALHALMPITLWGLPGVAVGLVPATFMTCLMIVLATTLLSRRRRRLGRAPMVVIRKTWLPRPVLLRAFVVALIATVLLTPIAVAGLHFALPGPYTLVEALACNGAYAIILAVLVAPPLLRAALSEAAS